MAILGVWTNAKVIVNSVDRSDHCTTVSVETSRDEVDVTAFGAANKVVMPGLGDGTIRATFLVDFVAGGLDEALQALSVATVGFPIEVRPVNSGRTTSNPAYVMTCLMYGYTPISGGIGDAATIDVTFRNASQTGLQRLTA